MFHGGRKLSTNLLWYEWTLEHVLKQRSSCKGHSLIHKVSRISKSIEKERSVLWIGENGDDWWYLLLLGGYVHNLGCQSIIVTLLAKCIPLSIVNSGMGELCLNVVLFLTVYVLVFCLHVCPCTMFMPVEDKRRHGIPWDWFGIDCCELPVWVLGLKPAAWRSNRSSEPLSQLSFLKVPFFIALSWVLWDTEW